MKKSLKILVFSLICFFVISSRCLAVNIDMNLSGNDIDASSNTVNSEIVNDVNNTSSSNSTVANDDYDQFDDAEYTSNTAANTLTQNNSTSGTSTSSSSIADRLQSLPESELGLTNILNILLIAVGVVLILLAIAIFIRLKK